MSSWTFSFVETERLDRIEHNLKSMQRKLDALLTSTGVPTEQLKELTSVAADAKSTSDALEQAIEHN